MSLVSEAFLEHLRTNNDSFFTRRLRAIQWTNNCASATDCSTATSFMEEALVELRYRGDEREGASADFSVISFNCTPHLATDLVSYR